MEHKPLEDRLIMWQRNVLDCYKDKSNEEIRLDIQKKAFPFAVMMSNIESDFNLSSVVRSANSFGAREVFYYGKKHFDRRGAICTYKYTDVHYLASMDDVKRLKDRYKFVGLENNLNGTTNLVNYQWESNSLIVLGSEGHGIELDKEVFDLCEDFVEIPSFGSTRSINAACAFSVAAYDYVSKVKVG